jgi:hypothetical protein
MQHVFDVSLGIRMIPWTEGDGVDGESGMGLSNGFGVGSVAGSGRWCDDDGTGTEERFESANQVWVRLWASSAAIQKPRVDIC